MSYRRLGLSLFAIAAMVAALVATPVSARSIQQISDAQLDSIIRYVEYARHPDDRGGWSIGHVGPVPEGLVTWFIAAAALVAVCMSVGRRLRA